MKQLVILILSFLTYSVAASSHELCLVELAAPVDAQMSTDELLKQALSKALLRISGQTYVLQSPIIKKDELLKLVKNYAYKNKDNTRVFEVTFDYPAVKMRLQNLGFALLPENRAQTIAWLAVTIDGSINILGSSTNEEIETIFAHKSADFALPLIFPFLDFDDLSAVELQDIIEDNTPVLEVLSKNKYDAQNILVGELIFNNDTWMAKVTLLNYPDAQWTITADSLDKVCNVIFNNIAIAMIAKDAPNSDKADKIQDNNLELENKVINKDRTMPAIRLQVLGIKNLSNYATIIAYLQRIKGVNDVELAEVGENTATFALFTNNIAGELKKIIVQDKFLIATETASKLSNEMRFKLNL